MMIDNEEDIIAVSTNFKKETKEIINDFLILRRAVLECSVDLRNLLAGTISEDTFINIVKEKYMEI
jgi:hypothetical protein